MDKEFISKQTLMLVVEYTPFTDTFYTRIIRILMTVSCNQMAESRILISSQLS